MPRTAYLIKHGQPQIVPGVPAHEWALAPAALGDLPELLRRLNPVPQIVLSSEEPKARATAAALAGALDVRHRPMLGLHEQLRYTAPFHADPADFQADLRRFFAQPGQVVSGEESADDARRRFATALHAALRANPQEVVAVVTHGTVMSLLAAHLGGLDPEPLWRRLRFLDTLTLEVPDTEPGEPLRLRLREPTV